MKVEETLGAAEIEKFLGVVSGDDDLAGFFDFLAPKEDSWKTKPVLKAGDGTGGSDTVSEAVKEVQAAVGTGVDGKWGPLTTAAVKAWQTSKGLPATGVFDSDNWAVLYGKKTASERQAATQKTVTDITGFAQGLLSSAQAGQGSQLPAPPPPPPEPESTFPWGWVLGGVAVVGLGVGVYMYVNREE